VLDVPIIKLLLVISVVLLLVWAFRNRRRVGMRAGARVAAFMFGGLAIASVLKPDITQYAASAVGVSRGTDLVLYALVVVFLFTSAGLYFRSLELERRMATLVRTSAIRDAVTGGGMPGQIGVPAAPDRTSS
jgi:small membrane protein